ncbi:MAG: translation initiation factor IF-2 associated domain-containing protein, partial [Steroidobacteraceae bacterium]
MAEVTVSQFAEVLKVPVDRLLVQLDQAGIKVQGPDDHISDDAKLELLTHLRRSHGAQSERDAAPRRITLKRKTQSELKLASGQGRARMVSVEVRQKRTYIKRDVLEEQARHQQDELDQKRREAEEAARQASERVEAERRERERLEAESRRRIEEEESSRRRAQDEARRLAEQRAREEEERRERDEQQRHVQERQGTDRQGTDRRVMEEAVLTPTEQGRAAAALPQ